MAFLLCGPGIAVRTIGPDGSCGKKGCSEPVCSRIRAVAALAAGFVVALIGRMAGTRVRGRRRDDARVKKAMTASVKSDLLTVSDGESIRR